MLISARPCRRPTSKSLKSCAGVILTAPLPVSGSAYSSATIGISRPTSGRRTDLPTRSAKRAIVRMHRDAGVAEHGFRPGRRDRDEPAGQLRHRIADMPQRALGLAALDFEIGDHRVHLRVPIDEPLVAVDQPFAIERDKDAADRGGETRVHREALALPIGRGAEAAQLAGDRAARLLLPLPDALDKPLAAEIALRSALLGDLVADDDLGGDAGMIGAGLPQHVAAAHALIADQHILQREGQRMPHMQAAGHVRRRHHDRIGRLVAVGVGGKRARCFPQRVAARLHAAGSKVLSSIAEPSLI